MAPDGTSRVCLYVSLLCFFGQATTSLAYEFALNLTTQKPGVTYDDTVFRTKNVVAACGYEAFAEGGVRQLRHHF